MDYINMKNFCSLKHCQENEKPSHELGENICKRHIWQKILSKIYKELLKQLD